MSLYHLLTYYYCFVIFTHFHITIFLIMSNYSFNLPEKTTVMYQEILNINVGTCCVVTENDLASNVFEI